MSLLITRGQQITFLFDAQEGYAEASEKSSRLIATRGQDFETVFRDYEHNPLIACQRDPLMRYQTLPSNVLKGNDFSVLVPSWCPSPRWNRE